jgi:(1->4)-alpha-D-glucan 1-alpha-D-glucosylmutase
VSPAAFHQRNQEQARRWPASMLCTSTHDTKRGEDVRARINVLSEMPHEWARKVRRWSTINWRRKTALEDGSAPSENDEYLFYQTLVGAWPLEFHGATEWDDGILADFRQRMVGYMLKAVREAKSHTSWINCDSDYESGLSGFVERVLDAERRNPFLDDFQQFHRRIAELGMLNGLAQTVLKLTVPGMPDLYQGSELWDLNLVDPDNRRPVDFEKRNQMIGRLSEMLQSGANAACPQLLEHWPDGMVKLFVVWRLLSLRRSHPDVFQEGDYLPLEALGTRANHLFSFVRSGAGRTLLVCVPRLLARLTLPLAPFATGDDVWADTFVALPEELAETSWRNVFTG